MRKILLIQLIIVGLSFTQIACASDSSNSQYAATAKSTINGKPAYRNEFRSAQYLYNDCKRTVSTESFNDSFCAATLSGFLSGYALATWAIPAFSIDDPCRDAKGAVVKEFQERLCVPDDTSLDDLGSHYVKYVDALDLTKTPEFSIDDMSLSLIGFFNSEYHCDSADKRKGN